MTTVIIYYATESTFFKKFVKLLTATLNKLTCNCISFLVEQAKINMFKPFL